MRNKWLLYIVLFMLTANAALVSTLLVKGKKADTKSEQFMPDRNFREGRGPGKFEQHLVEQLSLNEMQQQQLDSLSAGFRMKKKELRALIIPMRIEYIEMFSDETPDTAAMAKLAREIARMETLALKLDFKHYRNIRSICTLKQVEKLDSLGMVKMRQQIKQHKIRGNQGAKIAPKTLNNI